MDSAGENPNPEDGSMCTGRIPLLLGVSLFVSGVASAQTTERASVDSNGIEGNGPSGFASIVRLSAAVSSDGRFVAFMSLATNLVPGDTNGKSDVFVRDRLTGTTERVSVDSSGPEGDDDSGLYGIGISADGRFVVFDSLADNLVAGDTNGTQDLFVRDRSSGTTERVSVATGGAEADSFSLYPSISADGRWVSFLSNATNLVPGDVNGFGDIFVHDRQSGATSLVSVDSNGAQGNHASFSSSISGDGRYVAFVSWASNLGPVDGNGTFGYDVFVHDCVGGSTVGVSVDPSGAGGNGDSDYAFISADGRFVTFETTATNLLGGNPSSGGHILVRDLTTSSTSIASLNSSGEPGNQGGASPTISADGRYVVFESISSNFASGSHGYGGVFVRDRQLGTIERVSVDASGEGGDNSFVNPVISGDGLHVAFVSDSTTLIPGDTNGVTDIYVHDARPAAVTSFCAGDGSGTPCPCGNSGTTPRGCQNSSSTGGALLGASGHASLGQDTLRLSLYGARPTALSVFVQGDAAIAAVTYGDGLRCVGGSLKRLYVKSAQSGMAFAPRVADPSISVRSTALGDPITAGQTRDYFVYYRDPAPTFCPDPPGNTWNDSNALSAVWDP
jgi:Tol biopolymer transport system component